MTPWQDGLPWQDYVLALCQAFFAASAAGMAFNKNTKVSRLFSVPTAVFLSISTLALLSMGMVLAPVCNVASTCAWVVIAAIRRPD